jgi:hypothetical protein
MYNRLHKTGGLYTPPPIPGGFLRNSRNSRNEPEMNQKLRVESTSEMGRNIPQKSTRTDQVISGHFLLLY